MSLSPSSIQSQFNLNSAESAPVYEFERFRLDGAHLMLYENDKEVNLAPKVVETLLVLVERRGEIVGKGELFERLWKNAFVEESNLTQNIYLLRKTLGTTADGRPLIETFRRRGYRFNGELKTVGDVEILVAIRTQTRLIEEETAPKKNRNFFLAGVVLVGILLILAGFSILRFFNQNKQAAAPVGLPNVATFKRLMPDVPAAHPTISPDGKYLVYTRIENKNHSVWLMDLATASEKLIMPPSTEGYGFLQFSPDGSRLYYVTSRGSVPGILVWIPATGGPPREITRHCISPFTLSPDGQQVAFVNGRKQIVIANTDGSGERVLAERDGKTSNFESWGSQLSWSPDGASITICGWRWENGRRRSELLEISLTDGTERQISVPDWDYLDDVQWLPDRTGLLVIARETNVSSFQIWYVGYPNGEVRRITQDFQNYDWIHLSADASLLIAQQIIEQRNIWTVPRADAKQAKQLTFGLMASDGRYGVAIMPDGSIVYTSPRSGQIDLWIINADGSNPKQLTFNAGINIHPRITPDGKHIVFASTRTGTRQIWWMDADGGNPTQLVRSKFYEDLIDISADGQWVFYTQVEGANSSIWKIPFVGGEALRVSAHDKAELSAVSPDGKLISYMHHDEDLPNPWQVGLMSAETGETLKLFENRSFGNCRKWTADSKSLICGTGDFINIQQLPLDGGKPRLLTNFNSEQIQTFDVSPDGRTIVLSRGTVSPEVVLINNFR